MKIAAVQMVSTPSVERNLEAARRLMGSAAAAGAALVVLPEYFCFMGRSDRDKLAIAETPGDGPIQRMLAESARADEVWLIGGTLPLAVDAPGAVDRVLNANLVFSPRGELTARYDKMHLFAFDNGRERRGFHHGFAHGIGRGRAFRFGHAFAHNGFGHAFPHNGFSHGFAHAGGFGRR